MPSCEAVHEILANQNHCGCMLLYVRYHCCSRSVEPAICRPQLVQEHVHIRLLALLRTLLSDVDFSQQRKNQYRSELWVKLA